MLTVYTEHIGPRHEYIIGFMLQDILGLDIRLTADPEVISATETGLNYSTRDIPGHPYIAPHGLLDESTFDSRPRIRMDEDGRFFKTDSDIIDFDLFSAAFYLLSRYEEYSAPPSAFDEYGRYRSAHSLAGKNGFLHRPLIDEWALQLQTALTEKHPQLKFRARHYSYLCTFDIDVAYAYGGRGRLREWGSRLKDLRNWDTARMKERKRVGAGTQGDPYDTYAHQLEVLKAHQTESRYFFLVGDKGPLDHNLPHDSDLMVELVQEICTHSTIGIHPSMGSHESEKKLKNEISRLEQVSGRKVELSRQHFLNFQLPQTYQRLEAAGITEDYSMGYADDFGFRSSTCTPHQWYDLSKECSSTLRLVPLSVMDSTLKDYLKLSPDEAISEVRELIDRTRKVSGVFVSLWHNHSINDLGEWKGWKRVFESTIEQASN